MCTQFTKIIRVSSATHDNLEKLGDMGDTFDSVIRRLLTTRRNGEPLNSK